MVRVEEFLAEWNNSEPTVRVHTSGSTGKPKEMSVEKSRMLASAKMTCDFLNLKPGNTALLCMPLDYIAGKMVVVRSIERQMRLINVEPSSHPLAEVNEHIDFVAFVPLQVLKTLEVEEETSRFHDITNVIIGGGAIDAALETRLRACANNIYSTYGMTETLSHIALRKVSGEDASDWYTPFGNVHLSQTADGCLVIDAPLVCNERLITNDIVEMNPQGQFRVIGRKDNTINTGGVKVQIEEVEKCIREKVLHSDFMITSCKDSTFGEIVVMLVPRYLTSEQRKTLIDATNALPRYWKPKKIVDVDSLPTTETGKPDRATAKMVVKM